MQDLDGIENLSVIQMDLIRHYVNSPPAYWYWPWYYNGTVRTKHQHTLDSMFKRPPPADIRWADIVAMLKAADVEVTQRSGSRVLLKKGTERMVVHRPHPEPETGRATVRDIAVFLEAVGVKP